MSESGASPEKDPLASSIPDGVASLESILCTDELKSRPSRPPNYEKENNALRALTSALAVSPGTIFQTLAETIQEITECDSAGLSLLTMDGKTPDARGQRFFWPAIAGTWNPHVGGGTPREFGPCGDVLDRNRTLLFRHFERRYPYLVQVSPSAEECLLVPFYVGGQAVGTIWAIMHSDRRKFDAEDNRVMSSLEKFASSAYQAVVSVDDLKSQINAREKAESRLRELTRVEVGVILDGLEAQVRTSEQFHRVVVETASDAVVSIDHRGDILLANHATTRIFGYDSSELIGQPLTILMPEYLRKLHEEGLKRYQETNHRHINWQGTELIGLRKNGEEFPVEVSFGEITDNGHRVFTGFIRDISGRKQAEEALRTSERELRDTQIRLSRATQTATVGEFAASIAHEINQPLTAVLTNGHACLRWLSAQPPALAKAVEAAERIVRDGKEAGEIVRRIRALFKQGPLEKIALDLNEVIGEVLVLVHGETTRKRVVVETHLDKDLAPVAGDRVQLQQLLFNLVLNAIESMDSVLDRPKKLFISSKRHSLESVLVDIQDYGVGLKDPEKIFEAFFTTKENGMGMGLPVCRSIIEAHHGRLWAAPGETAGTTFSFTLPAATLQAVS